mmetsp:Transcript_8994/g.10316  ORF Transcript_8994/g.10316 Transcript_8994/m.10316 type:complete len:123 (-) Transcript_8994:27-395(-)
MRYPAPMAAATPAAAIAPGVITDGPMGKMNQEVGSRQNLGKLWVPLYQGVKTPVEPMLLYYEELFLEANVNHIGQQIQKDLQNHQFNIFQDMNEPNDSYFQVFSVIRLPDIDGDTTSQNALQ